MNINIITPMYPDFPLTNAEVSKYNKQVETAVSDCFNHIHDVKCTIDNSLDEIIVEVPPDMHYQDDVKYMSKRIALYVREYGSYLLMD